MNWEQAKERAMRGVVDNRSILSSWVAIDRYGRDLIGSKKENPMTDTVNQPSHYQRGGIECIDYIAAKLGPEGFKAYCLGNVLKYVSRHEGKGGDEDLRKAQVYLGWAIEGKRR